MSEQTQLDRIEKKLDGLRLVIDGEGQESGLKGRVRSLEERVGGIIKFLWIIVIALAGAVATMLSQLFR